MSNRPNLTKMKKEKKKKNSRLVCTRKPIITGWRDRTGGQRHRRCRERFRSDLQGCDKINGGNWTEEVRWNSEWRRWAWLSWIGCVTVTGYSLATCRWPDGEGLGLGKKWVWVNDGVILCGFLVWKGLINCCGSLPKVVATVNGKRMTLTVN